MLATPYRREVRGMRDTDSGRRSACDRFSCRTCTWARATAAPASCCEFLGSDRSRLSIPGRRHRRPVEPAPLLLLAAGTQRGAARRSSTWRARAPRSSTCPGNHDEELREFCGSVFGNLRIRRRYVHSTADGREFLVMHGDEFDTAVKCSRWLARFGAAAYDFTMRINRGVNRLPARCSGLPLLVARQLPQAAAAERRALRRGLRDAPPRRPRDPAQPRRHRLRPHPSRRHPRDRRRPVLQ